MRFYLDASIPAQAVDQVRPPHSVERWHDDANGGDDELLAQAARDGASVLVVMGREMLEQPGLAESARRAGLCLAAVDIDHPTEVVARIGRALHKLAGQAAPGLLFVINKTQIHQIEPPD